MRRVIAVVVLLLALTGCYCRRCQGQEAAEPEKATVVVTATDCEAWRQTLYAGLNRLTDQPWTAVCNILLVNAFGFERVPTGNDTVTITQANHKRMQKIEKSINAALGFAIVQQARVMDDNRAAVSAAIDSATETITDVKQRQAFLRKAKLLRGD